MSSIAFNESGPVTLGYDSNHRIITWGYGGRFEYGGPPRLKRRFIRKEEVIDVLVPVEKENTEEFKIYSPLMKVSQVTLPVDMEVDKEIKEEYEITGKLDHKKLKRILEAI